MYLQKVDLGGRRAVVTGGAQGIGAACADACIAGARPSNTATTSPAARGDRGVRIDIGGFRL